jgi:hypothetical protein
MKIIITESQSKRLLTESIADNIGETFESSKKSIGKLIANASEQIGMNLQFMMTWGAGITGFVGPITDYVKGEFPSLNDMELSLIITAVIATYFYENKKKVTIKLYQEIQENGLNKVFEKVLRKSDKFYNVFANFIESLAPTTHTIINMMSYSFIIPILPTIYNAVQSGMINNIDFDELTRMLIGFGGLTITSILIKNLLIKVAERFRGKS